MKGFTKDGKFHPIKPYNKVRKKRLDYNDPELMQHAGVKIIKDDSGKFIRMKRKGTRIKKRLRQPTVTIRTFTDKNGKKDYLVMFAGVGHYHETTRREAEASKKHLMKHIQAERKKGKIFKRGWERKARDELPQDELERAINIMRFIGNKPTSIKLLELEGFDDDIIKKAIDKKFQAGVIGEEKDPIVERFPHADVRTGGEHAGEFRKITIYPEREDYFECKVCGGLEAID